ncbi:hypothetical protein HY213_05260 [Candidatus Peregrinibacteria bacterium]|nr:hypothetical protein [Candidatus Peregrinibacteria bacterium]
MPIAAAVDLKSSVTEKLALVPAEDTPERLAALREIAALIQEELEKTGRVLADKTSADSGGPAISSSEPVAQETGAPLPLSADEQAKLFKGLQESLQKPENREGAPDISVIKAALEKNPTMMVNLRRLQKNRAELVVREFQGDEQKGERYVEFADAAMDLDRDFSTFAHSDIKNVAFCC